MTHRWLLELKQSHLTQTRRYWYRWIQDCLWLLYVYISIVGSVYFSCFHLINHNLADFLSIPSLKGQLFCNCESVRVLLYERSHDEGRLACGFWSDALSWQWGESWNNQCRFWDDHCVAILFQSGHHGCEFDKRGGACQGGASGCHWGAGCWVICRSCQGLCHCRRRKGASCITKTVSVAEVLCPGIRASEIHNPKLWSKLSCFPEDVWSCDILCSLSLLHKCCLRSLILTRLAAQNRICKFTCRFSWLSNLLRESDDCTND